MSAISLFFTGLTTGAIAGGASCAAVQGGLLAGAVGRRRVATAEDELVPAGRASEFVASDQPGPTPATSGRRRAAVARRAGLL
ncbi:MAG: sulfite exporter TauE/SafE family protein, partial [Sporichthyaceae bacterium]